MHMSSNIVISLKKEQRSKNMDSKPKCAWEAFVTEGSNHLCLHMAHMLPPQYTSGAIFQAQELRLFCFAPEGMMIKATIQGVCSPSSTYISL